MPDELDYEKEIQERLERIRKAAAACEALLLQMKADREERDLALKEERTRRNA